MKSFNYFIITILWYLSSQLIIIFASQKQSQSHFPTFFWSTVPIDFFNFLIEHILDFDVFDVYDNILYASLSNKSYSFLYLILVMLCLFLQVELLNNLLLSLYYSFAIHEHWLPLFAVVKWALYYEFFAKQKLILNTLLL